MGEGQQIIIAYDLSLGEMSNGCRIYTGVSADIIDSHEVPIEKRLSVYPISVTYVHPTFFLQDL